MTDLDTTSSSAAGAEGVGDDVRDVLSVMMPTPPPISDPALATALAPGDDEDAAVVITPYDVMLLGIMDAAGYMIPGDTFEVITAGDGETAQYKLRTLIYFTLDRVRRAESMKRTEFAAAWDECRRLNFMGVSKTAASTGGWSSLWQHYLHLDSAHLEKAMTDIQDAQLAVDPSNGELLGKEDTPVRFLELLYGWNKMLWVGIQLATAGSKHTKVSDGELSAGVKSVISSTRTSAKVARQAEYTALTGHLRDPSTGETRSSPFKTEAQMEMYRLTCEKLREFALAEGDTLFSAAVTNGETIDIFSPSSVPAARHDYGVFENADAMYAMMLACSEVGYIRGTVATLKTFLAADVEAAKDTNNLLRYVCEWQVYKPYGSMNSVLLAPTAQKNFGLVKARTNPQDLGVFAAAKMSKANGVRFRELLTVPKGLGRSGGDRSLYSFVESVPMIKTVILAKARAAQTAMASDDTSGAALDETVVITCRDVASGFSMLASSLIRDTNGYDRVGAQTIISNTLENLTNVLLYGAISGIQWEVDPASVLTEGFLRDPDWDQGEDTD